MKNRQAYTPEDLRLSMNRESVLADLMKRLERDMSGVSRSIFGFVRDLDGKYSEEKTQRFLDALMPYVEMHLKEHDDHTFGQLGDDISIDRTKTKFAIDAKDSYRSFLYCAVRFAEADLIPQGVPVEGTFADLIKFAEDAEAEKNYEKLSTDEISWVASSYDAGKRHAGYRGQYDKLSDFFFIADTFYTQVTDKWITESLSDAEIRRLYSQMEATVAESVMRADDRPEKVEWVHHERTQQDVADEKSVRGYDRDKLFLETGFFTFESYELPDMLPAERERIKNVMDKDLQRMLELPEKEKLLKEYLKFREDISVFGIFPGFENGIVEKAIRSFLDDKGFSGMLNEEIYQGVYTNLKRLDRMVKDEIRNPGRQRKMERTGEVDQDERS